MFGMNLICGCPSCLKMGFTELLAEKREFEGYIEAFIELSEKPSSNETSVLTIMAPERLKNLRSEISDIEAQIRMLDTIIIDDEIIEHEPMRADQKLH